MSSKLSSHTLSLKRKIQISSKSVKQQRQINLSEDDIIRSRLIFEGDQGSDDRRISTLIKIFHKSIIDQSSSSSLDIEKLLSLLNSIEHSYRLSKLTLQMDEREQIFYKIKSEHLYKQIKQLHDQLNHNDERLIAAKQRRLNLLEYNQRTDRINKLSTRKELRTQQISILERKYYFEHLQQTFETTYQQRLKQIAIYMRPIFVLDEILQQDIHEDEFEQSTIPIIERPRTYSDSSITSIDGDENISKKLLINSLSSSLANNDPQPLFSNEIELFGTKLVNPLLFYSSFSS